METTPIHRHLQQPNLDDDQGGTVTVVRRTQSDLGGESVITTAIQQQTWSQTITCRVNDQSPEDDEDDDVDDEDDDEEEESQPDSATSGVSSSRSANRKLTRHLAKAKLRRSASQPAVALNPSDEDAGLCLSEDDNLSDNDHHHHHQLVHHRHPQAENEVVRYSAATDGVLAIALWDHKAVEPEELSLGAGDVIHILDLSDPDWWWAATSAAGRQASYGWIPASYVQLCEPPFNRILQEQLQGRQVSARLLIGQAALSQHSVRANVITELITAERDYVKLLSDLVDVRIFSFWVQFRQIEINFLFFW